MCPLMWATCPTLRRAADRDCQQVRRKGGSWPGVLRAIKPLTLAMVAKVQIELGNDRAGSRVCQIGGFQIVYDRAGSRPKTVGQFELVYDMAGNRLRGVAPIRSHTTSSVVDPCGLATST